MVSTCLRGRSLLGACLEKTQRKRRSQPEEIPPHHLMSHCVTSLLPPFQLALGVILCPNVAWSGAALQRKMRGTIYNPSVQIFTQRDESTCVGQKKSPVPGTRSLAEPYTAMSGVRQRSGANKGAGGTGRDGWKRGEWKGWPAVQAQRWKPEERGQMDRQALWFGASKKVEGDFRAVAAASKAAGGRGSDTRCQTPRRSITKRQRVQLAASFSRKGSVCWHDSRGNSHREQDVPVRCSRSLQWGSKPKRRSTS